MKKKILPVALVAILAIPVFASAEGIAVIVSTKNQISGLTKAELSRIYRGRMTKWPDGKPLLAINRDARSDLRKDFYRIVLKSKPTEKFFLPGSPMPFRTIVHKSALATTRYVKVETRAIGYIYLSELTGEEQGIKVILEIME